MRWATINCCSLVALIACVFAAEVKPTFAADLPLKPSRNLTLQPFSAERPMMSRRCADCIAECRRKGGSFRQVCETLCNDTCGARGR